MLTSTGQRRTMLWEFPADHPVVQQARNFDRLARFPGTTEGMIASRYRALPRSMDKAWRELSGENNLIQAERLPGMPIDIRKPHEDEAIVEPMEIRFESTPKAKLELDEKNLTVLAWTMPDRPRYYVKYMDSTPLWRLLGEMVRMAKQFSQGRYSQAQLRRMGHPYGWQVRPFLGKRPARRRMPRQWLKGVRGSVPSKDVINVQSGKLRDAWTPEISPAISYDGRGRLQIKVVNPATTKKGFPYPWALAHGTVKMQPHGPWKRMVDEFTSRIENVWNTERRNAMATAMAARMANR